MMRWIVWFVTALLLGISLIRPIYPQEQYLQHTPTLFAMILFAWAIHKRWLGTLSVISISLFILLHIIGARYIYSNVPYDIWSQHLCGCSLSDTFQWERNHFDRLVHFCFGLLTVLPVYEICRRYLQCSHTWSLMMALMTVLSVSAVYEVFEWGLAVIMSPEHAEAYNGQQGDIWDAQKDMALALVGGLVTILLLMLCKTHFEFKNICIEGR